MSGFEKLLDEIEDMSKAIAQDDLRAAAKKPVKPDAGDGDGEGGDDYSHATDGPRDVKGRLKKKSAKHEGKAKPEPEAEPNDDDDAFLDGDDEPEPLKKSMSVTLENGEKTEVVDGTELVKSLIERVERNETSSVSAMRGLFGLIQAQGEMIKSLNDSVARIGQEGRGRKAVVTLAEKQPVGDLAKSEPQGISPDEFFAKALTAQAKGSINGHDIAMAEACLNRGQPIPADIIRRVML